MTQTDEKAERIAKRMARAGLCSRRDAEQWILDGRVKVNGAIIKSPALNVLPQDAIVVDGKLLQSADKTRLWRFHKPKATITSNKDADGRRTVFECLPPALPRVVTIGRLDFNTEGLLLLTNDGGLARHLELPSTGWIRRYRVRAYGRISQIKIDMLARGMVVDGMKYGPIETVVEKEQGDNLWLNMALREGKNREIRNVLGALDLSVNRLIRTSYGPFQLGSLAEGDVEEVTGKVVKEQLASYLNKKPV